MKAGNFFWFFLAFLLGSDGNAEVKLSSKTVIAQAQVYLREELIKKQPSLNIKQINIKSSPISHRLSLQPCVKPLTFSHRQSSRLQGRVSIKVSCDSSTPWSIYTRHQITFTQAILATNKPLPRNHTLQAEDLTVVHKDVFQLRPGFINNKDELIGKRLVRAVKAGVIFYEQNLSQPTVIKKGHRVNVIAKVGSLSVITSGIALSNGKQGDQIKVENKRSSRIITAKVIDENTVKVVL